MKRKAQCFQTAKTESFLACLPAVSLALFLCGFPPITLCREPYAPFSMESWNRALSWGSQLCYDLCTPWWAENPGLVWNLLVLSPSRKGTFQPTFISFCAYSWFLSLRLTLLLRAGGPVMAFLLSCGYTAVVRTLVFGVFDPRSLRLPFEWEVAGAYPMFLDYWMVVQMASPF